MTISWMAEDPRFEAMSLGSQPASELLAAGMGDSPIDFNPFLPEVHEDPYPLYERMRSLDPVHWNLPGVWMLTRHADAVRMLRHPRMSSDFRNSELFEMFRQMNPAFVDFTIDEVWELLMQRPPPWGGSHRDLITLYRNAQGGECPLVICFSYRLYVLSPNLLKI